MSDDELFKYSHEQILNALHRFRRQYPASYRNFFLYELEKPYSPFDSEAIHIVSEKDMEFLKREPAPLKILVPVVIEEDEQDT